MKIQNLLTLLAFGIGMAIATEAYGEMIEIRPTEDRDAYADGGTTYQFRPDGGGALIVGMGWTRSPYRTVMEFSLAEVGADVESATLTYDRQVVANGPAAYTLHGYHGDGVITLDDLMVDNQIGPVLTTLDPTSINVSDFVQTAFDAHATHVGFLFCGFPGGSGFSMRSSEPYVNSPLLIVQTVPEPTTVTLLVMGAIFLLWRCRRELLVRTKRWNAAP